MRGAKPSRAGKRQQGRGNRNPSSAKHMLSLGKFRRHEARSVRDDSGKDCLIGTLIVPISCFKQPKNANGGWF
jgi:hypothetical protein